MAGRNFLFVPGPTNVPERIQRAMMVSMEVDEEELAARLLNRGKTSGRSDDQDEKTIRNRFQVYLNETEPLKTYYQSQKKLRTIDGIGTIDEIFNRICNAIDG